MRSLAAGAARDDAISVESGEQRVVSQYHVELSTYHSQLTTLNSPLAKRHPEERSDEGPL